MKYPQNASSKQTLRHQHSDKFSVCSFFATPGGKSRLLHLLLARVFQQLLLQQLLSQLHLCDCFLCTHRAMIVSAADTALSNKLLQYSYYMATILLYNYCILLQLLYRLALFKELYIYISLVTKERVSPNLFYGFPDISRHQHQA